MAVRASLAHADDTPPPPTAEVPTTVEPPATPPAAVTEAPAVPAARAPTPPPYSVPWQFRPIVAPTVLRFDTSAAFCEDARGRGGATIASLLTASYRIPVRGRRARAPHPRARGVRDGRSAPGNQKRGGATFVNPLVGAAYAIKLDGGFRLNAFLGATIPVVEVTTPFAGSVNSRVKG